ncbi:MAG: alginate O-acetyltransferase AlgX-related protein [Patescibacteria group bacterium]
MKIFNKKIIIILNILALLAICLVYLYFLEKKQTVNLLVDAMAQTEDTFQLFYDTGRGFNSEEIINAKIEKNKEQTLIFTLNVPYRDLKGLRLDPGSENKEIKIKQITLKTKKQELKFSPEIINKNFLFSRDVIEKKMEDGFLSLTLSGNDPQIFYNGEFFRNSYLDDNIFLKNILLLTILALLITLIALSGPIFIRKFKKINFIRVENYYFVILFFLLLCVPMSQMILKFLPEKELREGRSLAVFPRLELLYSINNWHNYLKSVQLFFEDNYGFRSTMINANLLLNLKYFNINLIEDVVIGKDGWLFYDSRVKGDIGFSSFYGKSLYNKNELAIIKKNLLNLKNKLKEKNIGLVLVMAANKESIYSEYLPDNILSKRGVTSKADQINQISKEIGLIYVDTRPLLLAAKKDYVQPLYYKGDTHWNDLSGFLVSNRIMNIISAYRHEINPVNEIIKPEIIKMSVPTTVVWPDLARMINFYNYKNEYNFVPNINKNVFVNTIASPVSCGYKTSLNKNATGKIVLFGDSFSAAIVQYLSESVYQGFYVHNYDQLNINYNLISKENPDIVIVEFVERFSDQLLKLEI